MTRFAAAFSCSAALLCCLASGCQDQPVQKPSDAPAVEITEAEKKAIATLETAEVALKKDASGRVLEADYRACKNAIQADLISPLKDFASLTAVNLSGVKFEPDASALAALPAQIVSLDLRDAAISDTDLPHITHLTALRSLRFSGKNGSTNLSDDGLSALTKFTNLKVLALDDIWVSTAGIQAIRDLSRLEELYLAATVIDDDALSIIAAFPALRKLRLARTSVGDKGLEALKVCTKLEELDLSENSIITDAGMTHLAAITSLKKLNLWRLQITDTGVLALAPLKGLNWLNLDNTKLSDAGLPALKDMSSLTFLHLGSTQITEQGVPALVHLKSLNDLKITRTALGSSEKAVAELQAALSNTKIQVEYEGK